MPRYLLILFSHVILFLFTSAISFSQDDDNIYKIKLNEFEISFSGTATFDESSIEALLKTPTYEYFDVGELRNDMDKIKKFYFDNGFFDTEIDTSILINYKAKTANVKVTINEEKHYVINKIEVIGLESVSNDILKLIYDKEKVIIKSGDFYSRNYLNQEIFRIVNVLNNNGYADASFDPPEIIKIISSNQKSSNTINIKVYIRPNIQYTINKITFSIRNNNHNISLDKFYNEIDIKENELYSKENIVMTENKLSRISIIEYIRIQTEIAEEKQNRINLIVHMSLNDKYELQPQVFGYDISNRFYAGVGLSFSDKYFLGGGRTQTTSAKVLVHSLDINALELNFQLYQPYIFNNYKIKGNWELKATMNSEEVFRISTIQNTFQIVYELPNYTYINNLGFDWKLSNQRFSIRNAVTGNTIDSSVILSNDFLINVFTSVFGLSLLHNNSNNLQFPTSGNIQVFSAEESGSLGNLLKKLFTISTISYVKFTGLSKFYFNLSGIQSKSVIATKLLVGSIFEYGDNKLVFGNQTFGVNIVPLEYKYIAGGSTSVRGWSAKKLGTFDGKENGGNFLIEGSLEHRTRPFLGGKGIFKDLGFVTFFDYGNLWETPKSFRISDIALAIGFGIRYYTIVGPVRFDIGVKLYDYDPGIGIDKWLFNNSFSTIFKTQLAFQFGIGNTF